MTDKSDLTLYMEMEKNECKAHLYMNAADVHVIKMLQLQ